MRTAVIILAIIGIVVSGYSWYTHNSGAADTFCDVSTVFSCSTVNKSIYSEFASVPVAAIGLLGYTVLLLLVSTKQLLWRYLFAAGVIGTVFSLYLTWIEFAVLKTFCILCLISQADILAITILAGVSYHRGRYGSEQKN